MKPLRENREINQREDRRWRMCVHVAVFVDVCVVVCVVSFGGDRQTLGKEGWEETLLIG